MLPVLILDGILLVIAILLVLAEKFLVTYGICKVIINKEKTLEVCGGDNLLNYFVQNKIFIPSACGGKATCGYCKVRVLSGAGNILPTEEVYISRKEKLAGIRLSCQVKIKNDIEVLIPSELLEAQEYKVTVVKIEDLTHDIKLILLRLDQPNTIKFKPGQYVQFKIPQTDEFRAYSVASSPSQNSLIELTVRLVPGGLCSTYIHEALDVFDEITLTGPFGEFYLREETFRDIICIGGGCGMAPLRSIIHYLAEKNMPRRILYFFGARSKKDLFFTEELKELEKKFTNFKYIPALSEPKPQDKWEGEVGLITQVAEKYLEDNRQKEAYLCGPPPMIDAAINVLTRKGVNEENIHFDKF